MFSSALDLFLQVGVDTEANVVLPRTRLESVPFAIHAANVPDGGIAVGALDTTVTQALVQPGTFIMTGEIVAPPG
jgi:hypothetical protein